MNTTALITRALLLPLLTVAATAAADTRFEQYLFNARPGASVYLANHDTRGIPLDIDPTTVPISADLLDRIAVALPEGRDVRKAGVNLITDDAGANITLGETGEVFVTFIHEGAGFTNSFGYIAYPADNPPANPADAEHVMVFPNASSHNGGGSARGLYTGQQVSLGVFPAGTRISFFVVAQGWTATGVVPFGTVPSWATGILTGTNAEDWVFYSLQGLNAETGDLAAHTVLLNDSIEGKIILGMEDIMRTNSRCDHDFNDMLFAIESNPPTAIETEGLLELAMVADRDGDGVPDGEDDLPDDPLGAFVVTYPAEDSHATLAFEDNWPSRGDYDMNDLVLRYQLQQIRTIDGGVKAIRGEFEMMARGASYPAAFGMHFLGIAPAAMERATVTIGNGKPVSLTSEKGQSALTLILVPNVIELGYHSHWCWYFNTQDCAEVAPPRFAFELVFAEPIAPERLGDAPYNPFIYLTAQRAREVHLPNHPATDLIGRWAIGSAEDDSQPADGRWFLGKNNLPWALNIPVDWHHPREWVPVETAYPLFTKWVGSGGTEAQDWYLYEHRAPAQVFKRTLTGAPESP